MRRPTWVRRWSADTGRTGTFRFWPAPSDGYGRAVQASSGPDRPEPPARAAARKGWRSARGRTRGEVREGRRAFPMGPAGVEPRRVRSDPALTDPGLLVLRYGRVVLVGDVAGFTI